MRPLYTVTRRVTERVTERGGRSRRRAARGVRRIGRTSRSISSKALW
jgi:hypothetical protein